MMTYSSETAKWNAYQFNDPFASDKFIVCNKSTNICCRPNCDLSLQTSLKSEVLFVDTVEKAERSGYVKCPHCLISSENSDDLNTISIDVDLLIQTVATVNEQIGFVPPLDDEDPHSQSIREAVLRKTKLRRGSVPAIHLNSSSSNPKNTSAGITKNETDHVKLVDLACRHIALAAASTAVQIHEDQTNKAKHQARQHEQEQQLAEDRANGNKKRRRRGGVLGFKELASKSKLSPWHFHRVFKSVTGLTPKVYGDKCWEFAKKYIDQHGSFSSQNAIVMSTSLTNPTSSPPDEQTTGANTMNAARARDSRQSISKPKIPDTDMVSPDSDLARASPFSNTIDDFITTPQSANSITGKSYTSPMLNQRPGIDFGQYSMQPVKSELVLDSSIPNTTLPMDSLFLNNEVDVLQPPSLAPQQFPPPLQSQQQQTTQEQQQLQDMQWDLQMIDAMNIIDNTNNNVRTKSTPNPNLTLDLMEFGNTNANASAAAADWNFLQTQNSSSNLFQPQDFTLNLNDKSNTANPMMSSMPLEKANSDSGEYVQTPFNFDLNNYGYFGEFNSLNNWDNFENNTNNTNSSAFRA